MCKAPLDWGQVTCVTLRSLHSLHFTPRLRLAALAVRTLLWRLLSTRIVPEQLEYIHIWLDLNVLVLNVLNTPWLLSSHTTERPSRAAHLATQMPAHSKPGDCVDGTQVGQDSRKGPLPRTQLSREGAAPWHSPQGFPLALCPRQALIPLHLASIAHGQAQPGRKCHILSRLAESPPAAEPLKGHESTLAVVLFDKPEPGDGQEAQTALLQKRQHKLFQGS